MARKSQNLQLAALARIQKNIVLVRREYPDEPWSDRCVYLGDKYIPTKPYNHRSVLTQEVVIEYDDEPGLNKKLTDRIVERLDAMRFQYSVWTSGNKSLHVHTFIDTREAKNVSALKRSFVRYVCGDDLPLPDMQLMVENHLIRAEFGVHEKTGKQKLLRKSTKQPLRLNRLHEDVWIMYKQARNIEMRKKASYALNNQSVLDHEGFKHILSTTDFREHEDGHERALFILIHVLKGEYKDRKQEFISFLQDWYRYTSGYKLRPIDIENKVRYQWNREYPITPLYIDRFLEELGAKEKR